MAVARSRILELDAWGFGYAAAESLMDIGETAQALIDGERRFAHRVGRGGRPDCADLWATMLETEIEFWALA